MTVVLSAMIAKDWADPLAATAPIIGGIGILATAIAFAIRARAKSVAALRNGLARCWTSENELTGQEIQSVDLELRHSEAGLVGQVTSKAADRPFEAHVYVGWWRVTLVVFELRRRSRARVARVRLRLVENRSRLDWQLVGPRGGNVLPRQTQLWPNPRRPSRLSFGRRRSY